jgi:membrane protein implicated in regulation of membrane protease activity
MSDRGLLFLFSILMIAAALGAVVWLIATGQAGTVDGLFLVLTALITAACFALYAVFLLRRAMEAAAKPAAKAAPAGAKSPAAKAAAVGQVPDLP